MLVRFLFCIVILALCLSVSAQNASPISAEVRDYNGRPMIMINDQPVYPAIYALTDIPGGRWSWEELPAYNMRSFCERGFRLVQVDIAFDHFWLPGGVLSLYTTIKQIRGVLKNCPNAAIFIRLHVNPPKWWQHAHPEEKTLYADTNPKPDYAWGLQRLIEDDEETPDRTSLASQKWKDTSALILRNFLGQLSATPEGNAVAGIQVASGVYGEWHYWGFINNEPDTGKPMQHYFRNWLREKYSMPQALQSAWKDPSVTFENAKVPGVQERIHTSEGVFRNPQQERKVIDYYQAQHACVAEDILYYCKLVKSSWPRKIITGAFYGYFYAVFGREAAGGHLELQKVLQSPDIDFLCGPGTYYPAAVNMGDAYRSRSLITSIRLHHKLWLDEMDQQSPLVPLKDSTFRESVQKSIAQERRNQAFTYTNGAGLWFYDFGPSGMNGGKRLLDHGSWGWWDEPAVMEDIRKMKSLMDRKVQSAYHSDADVLLVHDTKSFYYTGSEKDDSYLQHWVNNWVPPALFKSGAVHDAIHVDDLDKIDLDDYRAIIFVNTWILTNTQKKFIAEKVAKNNRSLYFLYAPGYCDGVRLDTKFIEEVSGISIKKVIISQPVNLVLSEDFEGEKSYTLWQHPVNPLFTVQDSKAEILGTSGDKQFNLIARKKLKDATSIYIAFPPNDPGFWRTLLKSSGAHLYETNGDVLYSGGDILSVHTATGGTRKITLINGKTINIDLPPNSTTLLDARTGEPVL